jgi:hypothetical protein
MHPPHLSRKRSIDAWGGNDGAIVGEPETVEGRNGDGLRFDGINDADVNVGGRIPTSPV